VINEDKTIFNHEMQEKLWKASLELSMDEKTTQIAKSLQSYSN
jgi:hypothetical protein